MQYKSPIRIFEYCNIDCRAIDIAKAKKTLAAEFAIAPGGIITIDGFDYSKNDVFTELEHKDFKQWLSFHLLIWQTPNLLNCLEKNMASLKTAKTLIKLHADNNNRPFIRFISSGFTLSLDKIMRNLLYEGQFRDAAQWLKTLCLIDNVDDEYTALSSTRNCIADFIKLLRNLNEVTYKDHLQDLEKWLTQPWSLFINQLPDSFYETKHELLSAMIGFTFVIKQVDVKLCLKASNQMRKVKNTDKNVRALIDQINLEYYNRSQPRLNEIPIYWFMATIIFFFILFRICSPSDSTTKSLYSPSKSTNNSLPKISQKELLRGYVSLCFNRQRRETGEFFQMSDSIRDRKNFNKEFKFSFTMAYYMLFEKKDTLTSIKILIMNKGSDTLFIYAGEGKFKFTVAPSNMLWIEGSTNAIELLHFPQMNPSSAYLTSTAVLISDTKNQVAHVPKWSNVRSYLNYNSIQPTDEADFTVELLKDPLTGINRLTFSGLYWVF